MKKIIYPILTGGVVCFGGMMSSATTSTDSRHRDYDSVQERRDSVGLPLVQPELETKILTAKDSVNYGLTSADSVATGEDFKDLEELVVVRQKKLVQNDGATLTYNVTEDPESGSSNVLDILKKVPGVMVDAEDNVKVNGQSSFRVLMNGREDPMFKGDIKTILKSLPAASIKKIEVISEPGAKYEAEGAGGILNIVTDKTSSLEGIMAQFGGWANAYGAGAYANGRSKINKVMLDAQVNYNNGRLWPRSYTSDRELEYLDDATNSRQIIHEKSKQGWDYVGGRIGMSWEPDTLNLFTLSANIGHNTWGGNGKETRRMLNHEEETIWLLERDTHTPGTYDGVGAEASFQHNFGKDTHSLVLSYMFDYSSNLLKEAYLTTDKSGLVPITNFNLSRVKYGMPSHVVQLDYINKFNSKHLFEAGAKVNINNSSSLSRMYNGVSEAEAIEDEKATTKLTQIKDIYALYATYTGTFGSWNMKGGLRYEHTRMGLRYKIGEYPDFTTHLNDLVPNVAISYNLASATALRLAYQMRITRPGINMVNPYVESVTPGQIYYGNPDLTTAKLHRFSLSYSNYQGKVSGSAKLSYDYTGNPINDVMFMKNNILNQTYANTGYQHQARLDVDLTWSIAQWVQWNLYASGNYSYAKVNSELLKAKGLGWQTNLSTYLNFTLPRNVTLNVNGGMWTPWRSLQTKGTNMGYYYNIGIGKSWLKDKALTLNAYAGNFLPSSRVSTYEMTGEGVIFRQRNRYSQWNVGVGISYKFGGLRVGMKSTAANVEKESSGVQGQQGGK